MDTTYWTLTFTPKWRTPKSICIKVEIAQIAVFSAFGFHNISYILSQTLTVCGVDEQDRVPGEAFTPKGGKEAEMEKLMRSLNVSLLQFVNCLILDLKSNANP